MIPARCRRRPTVRRAEAYDVYRDRRYLAQRESQRKKMLAELDQIGSALIGAGVTRLTGREAKDGKGGVEALDLNEASFSDVVNAIREGVRLRLRSSGLSLDLSGRFGLKAGRASARQLRASRYPRQAVPSGRERIRGGAISEGGSSRKPRR
jgi:hypothetical protein